MSAVQRLESGFIRDPHYSTLSGIARALGTTVAELVGEEQPAKLPKVLAPPEGPSESEAGEWPKTVAEVRAKFLPIAAMLEDYTRAYEQIARRTEPAELEDDVEAFLHTAVEARGYHLAAIEGELVELGHALGPELESEKQLHDLSVLRPAFTRYRKLMRTLVELLPAEAGEVKNRLLELSKV